MKRVLTLTLICCAVIFAFDWRLSPRHETYGPPYLKVNPNLVLNPIAVRIDSMADYRGIGGSDCKNICADTTGRNAAVLYGRASGDAINIFITKLAYTTNQGTNWSIFGPFRVRYTIYRRMYGGIDARGALDWTDQEKPFFIWHEAYRRGTTYAESSIVGVGYDDGYFPNGTFVTKSLPHSGDPEHNLWITCIAVRPDNPSYLVAQGGDYNFTIGGMQDVFFYRSIDAGANWLGPTLVLPGSATAYFHDTPHFRWGTNGYVFAFFNRSVIVGTDTLSLPHYIESSDNGATWVPPNGAPFFTTPPYPKYYGWWFTYDCEVVNNNPYVLLTPGMPGPVWVNRVDFWKGTGPIGNRTWNMTLLFGDPVPDTLADSVAVTCNLVRCGNFPRFCQLSCG